MELRNKLVVIFGGSGFVGRSVVRALAKSGARIRVAMRRPHLGGDLRLAGDPGQIQLVQANLRVASSVQRAMEHADIVVNLVGLLYEKGPQNFRKIHIDGAQGIADAAKAHGIRHVVHVSAIGADDTSRVAYARTKGEAEFIFRSTIPATIILRPSVIFGEGDGFLTRFARMAMSAPFLPSIGFGRTRFQPIHVEDVADALVRALERPDAQGRIFELGGGNIYRFDDILRLILRVTDRRALLVPIPFFGAKLLGLFLEIVTRPVPGLAPPLTAGQVDMLMRDNVVDMEAHQAGTIGIFQDLGLEPRHSLEASAPAMLWPYRTQGQFHEFSEKRSAVDREEAA